VPLPVEKQIAIIFAGTQGFLDAFPVSSLQRYELEMYDFIDAHDAKLWEDIRTKKELDEGLKSRMKKLLTDFGKKFVPETKG